MPKFNPDEQPAIPPRLLVSDMLALINGLLGNLTGDGDALRLLVSIKRLENVCGQVGKKHLEAANSEFLDLAAGADGQKEILFHSAVLKFYARRYRYGYPPAVVSLEAELAKQKKIAHESGTAVKEGPEFDMAADKGFSVSTSAQVKVAEDDSTLDDAANVLFPICDVPETAGTGAPVASGSPV